MPDQAFSRIAMFLEDAHDGTRLWGLGGSLAGSGARCLSSVGAASVVLCLGNGAVHGSAQLLGIQTVWIAVGGQQCREAWNMSRGGPQRVARCEQGALRREILLVRCQHSLPTYTFGRTCPKGTELFCL